MKPANYRTALLAAGALILAVGGGYGIARLTAPPHAQDQHGAEEEGHEEKGHAEGAEGDLQMDAARIAAASIQLQPVGVGGLSGEILAQANVRAAPDGEAVLTARSAGSVTRIFKRLGDMVRAGEAVAVVESAGAAAITADRRAAGARVTHARQKVERERRLFEQKVSPRQDLETAEAELAAAEAEAAGAAAQASAARVGADGRSVTVSSPISGRITGAPAALGAYVQPETELFRVADPTKTQIEAAVTALDARRVKAGDPASLEASDGANFPAVVRSVTPAVDETTRTATVVLTATGSASSLAPGQFLRARITPATGASSGIVIPEEAIQTVEGRFVVFVRIPSGFHMQPVTVGQQSGGRAVILSGLTAGQQIAVRGAFLLKAELGKGEAEHEH